MADNCGRHRVAGQAVQLETSPFAEHVGPRAKDFMLLTNCSSALDGSDGTKKSQAELGFFYVWTGIVPGQLTLVD